MSPDASRSERASHRGPPGRGAGSSPSPASFACSRAKRSDSTSTGCPDLAGRRVPLHPIGHIERPTVRRTGNRRHAPPRLGVRRRCADAGFTARSSAITPMITWAGKRKRVRFDRMGMPPERWCGDAARTTARATDARGSITRPVGNRCHPFVVLRGFPPTRPGRGGGGGAPHHASLEALVSSSRSRSARPSRRSRACCSPLRAPGAPSPKSPSPPAQPGPGGHPLVSTGPSPSSPTPPSSATASPPPGRWMVSPDGTTLTVTYWGGVQGCYGLKGVEHLCRGRRAHGHGAHRPPPERDGQDVHSKQVVPTHDRDPRTQLRTPTAPPAPDPPSLRLQCLRPLKLHRPGPRAVLRASARRRTVSAMQALDRRPRTQFPRSPIPSWEEAYFAAGVEILADLAPDW